MGNFSRPTCLDDALRNMENGSWRILAGGTDFYPAQGDRPITENLLDLTAIPELRGISQLDDGWRFGGLTTWSDVIKASLPLAFDGLKAAAREVGSIQIQNSGTIAGNICNASPAADGMPPLLSLSAEVELVSPSGTRRMPLDDFVTGVRSTSCRPDELVRAVHIPAVSTGSRSAFLKLGARRYLVISIAMAAVLIDSNDQGKITRARIAVGSCSPVAQRLIGLEQRLLGESAASGLSELVTGGDISVLNPINDVRASASYRLSAAEELVRRALEEAVRPGVEAS
ncbi:xanthine dehydrogenase family protein subunit M [Pelagibius sp. Alg239-R121]|uniref:FAD binding domain-containing protein n=1 Tax=Pelagibius sp. Alg239-R121 TaxID=2993448 RepID=UPI0024A6C56E|nr:xanthine dehydrogenase family protein subunit M [Pelagibius sp. Alg239-R121]